MSAMSFRVLVLVLAAGCTRQSSPPAAATEDAPPTPVAASSTPAAPVASVSRVAGVPDAGPTEAAPTAPSGAGCEKDQDCGWDDPCTPRTCGAKVEVDPGKKCGRPTTPGACRCAGNVCSLIRPEKMRAAERTACASHADCAFDPTAGTCVAGPASSTPAGGIQCQCDMLNKWCVQMWQGDVPCKSSRDCSWRHLNGGGTSAAPAWYAPRQKPVPVRPCKDGEHDSMCVDGRCEIRAWKC